MWMLEFQCDTWDSVEVPLGIPVRISIFQCLFLIYSVDRGLPVWTLEYYYEAHVGSDIPEWMIGFQYGF